MSSESKQKKNYIGVGMAIGAGMGVAIGAGIGAATDNFGFWVAIGVALGPAMGLAVGAVCQPNEKTDHYRAVFPA